MLGLLRFNYKSERKPQLTEETEDGLVSAALELVKVYELPDVALAEDDEATGELLCNVLEDELIEVPLSPVLDVTTDEDALGIELELETVVIELDQGTLELEGVPLELQEAKLELVDSTPALVDVEDPPAEELSCPLLEDVPEDQSEE
jgi:hypothetical protein